jgi:predicted transcriptional regulator
MDKLCRKKANTGAFFPDTVELAKIVINKLLKEHQQHEFIYITADELAADLQTTADRVEHVIKYLVAKNLIKHVSRPVFLWDKQLIIKICEEDALKWQRQHGW